MSNKLSIRDLHWDALCATGTPNDCVHVQSVWAQHVQEGHRLCQLYKDEVYTVIERLVRDYKGSDTELAQRLTECAETEYTLTHKKMNLKQSPMFWLLGARAGRGELREALAQREWEQRCVRSDWGLKHDATVDCWIEAFRRGHLDWIRTYLRHPQWLEVHRKGMNGKSQKEFLLSDESDPMSPLVLNVVAYGGWLLSEALESCTLNKKDQLLHFLVWELKTYPGYERWDERPEVQKWLDKVKNASRYSSGLRLMSEWKHMQQDQQHWTEMLKNAVSIKIIKSEEEEQRPTTKRL